jgi:hypothetical protein
MDIQIESAESLFVLVLVASIGYYIGRAIGEVIVALVKLWWKHVLP